MSGMVGIGMKNTVVHLEDDAIVCSLAQGSKCHPRIAESNVTSNITCSKEMFHARVKKGARELGCLLYGPLGAGHM
jgi:hypothetical protein